ncbi:MAG: hypothetical protein FWH40_09425, partial [Coriobacteriia bacterium]|nr:hypothetical protein [Coriobacteriia bacterium]
MSSWNRPWWSILSERAIVISSFGLLLPWYAPKVDAIAYIKPGTSLYFVYEFFKTEDRYDLSLLFSNAINTLTIVLFASVIASIVAMLFFTIGRKHYIPQISIGLPLVTLT